MLTGRQECNLDKPIWHEHMAQHCESKPRASGFLNVQQKWGGYLKCGVNSTPKY